VKISVLKNPCLSVSIGGFLIASSVLSVSPWVFTMNISFVLSLLPRNQVRASIPRIYSFSQQKPHKNPCLSVSIRGFLIASSVFSVSPWVFTMNISFVLSLLPRNQVHAHTLRIYSFSQQKPHKNPCLSVSICGFLNCLLRALRVSVVVLFFCFIFASRNNRGLFECRRGSWFCA
jgi:hypothetical protein